MSHQVFHQLLTQEVSNGLQGLLLAHDEADLLLSLVSEKLAVANATLLPLVVSESEELASHLEDGLFLLLTSLGLNLLELNLYKKGSINAFKRWFKRYTYGILGSFVLVNYVVFLLLNHFSRV